MMTISFFVENLTTRNLPKDGIHVKSPKSHLLSLWSENAIRFGTTRDFTLLRRWVLEPLIDHTGLTSQL